MVIADDGSDWPGAVIFFDDGMRRPAAFVWLLEGGGVTWIEPSYADPYGASSPSLHTRHSGCEALPYDSSTDRVYVGDALDWFEQYLADHGLSRFEERARLARELNLP